MQKLYMLDFDHHVVLPWACSGAIILHAHKLRDKTLECNRNFSRKGEEEDNGKETTGLKSGLQGLLVLMTECICNCSDKAFNAWLLRVVYIAEALLLCSYCSCAAYASYSHIIHWLPCC